MIRRALISVSDKSGVVELARELVALAVENIDIGGPAMIRSAAKNADSVAVVVAPAEYGAVLAELREHAGALTGTTRRRLARIAFAHTAAYDAAIAGYLAAAEGTPEAE